MASQSRKSEASVQHLDTPPKRTWDQGESRVEAYIKQADKECRRYLLSIIASCPAILESTPDEDLAWATGLENGAVARLEIVARLEEVEYGSH